jgi:hypothetical protein
MITGSLFTFEKDELPLVWSTPALLWERIHVHLVYIWGLFFLCDIRFIQYFLQDVLWFTKNEMPKFRWLELLHSNSDGAKIDGFTCNGWGSWTLNWEHFA